MIATADPPKASSLDSIRAELNVPAPSTQTLRFLRTILGLDAQEPCEISCDSARTPAEPKKAAKPRNPAKGVSRQGRNGKPTFRIHETANHEVPRLSAVDCRRIATEVFNQTLKQLGQAAKVERDASNSKPEGLPPLRPSHADRALQERSPNRNKKKDAIKSEDRSPCAEVPDWRVVAECSSAALHYLRQCDNRKGETSHETGTGMENAALILLDRTITLNLQEQAMAQLSVIHQRYWGHQATKCPTPKEEHLSKFLLGRQDAIDQNQTFGFTASMQSQVLRLAILSGPNSISKEFLESLKLETVGSPAWVIARGLQKGWLDSEKASLQLRTISLALTKLYTLAVNSRSEAASSVDVFDLACAALRIKFESWTHSGHVPDPGREVWRHLHSAVKRLFTNATDVQAASLSVIERLRLFRKLLNIASVDDTIPLELIETLSQVTPNIHDQSEMLLLMEEQLPCCDPVAFLILNCRITGLRLRCISTGMKSAIKRTQDAFTKKLELSKSDLERVILPAAHLRKVSCEAMMTIEKPPPATNEDESNGELKQAIIGLIFACSVFLCKQILLGLLHPTQCLSEDRQQSFLTTLIKSIDAILYAEKHALLRTPGLHITACDALQCCSSTIDSCRARLPELLANTSTQANFNQLRVRLSQIFWRRFLKAVEERKGLQEQIQILDSSLKGLSQLPVTDQKAAYLGLKYERLAACYLEVSHYEMAKSALHQAISFNIRDGTLSDVVELLLAGPFSRAWSKSDSNCKSLARNLTTYAQISPSLSTSEGNDDIFYDCRSLPAIHRAALLEKQVYAMMEKGVSGHQLSLWGAQVTVVWELLNQQEYHVYRLRFVNNLLHLALRRRMSTINFPIDSRQVQTLLAPRKKQHGTIFLQEYEPGLRSLLKLQSGFFMGLVTMESLEEEVKHLSGVIRACEVAENADKLLDNLGTCVATLQLSADYASVFGTPRTGLMALETIHHITELGFTSPELSRTNILIQAGRLHNHLQDLRSAQIYLAEAEKTLDRDEAGSLLEVEFSLAYSEYHFSAGDFPQSFDWLRRAKGAWEMQERPPGALSSKARLREQTILCRSFHLASQLAYQQGQLLAATMYARQSVKIVAGLWMSIDKIWSSPDHALPVTSPAPDVNNLALEWSGLDRSLQQTQRLTPSVAIYGPQISLYCSIFSHLAFLTAHCGLYQDAVYLYEQALKVARNTTQTIAAAGILSQLSLLHARAGQWEKAKQGLNELLPQPAYDNTPLSSAIMAIDQAEVHCLFGDPSSARQHLVKASQRLLRYSQAEEPKIGEKPKSKRVKVSSKAPARKPTVKLQNKHISMSTPSADPTLASSGLSVELRRARERLSALEVQLQLLDHHHSNTNGAGYALNLESRVESPRGSTAEALYLVQSALKLFSEDAVSNVLAETAIALPVRYRSTRTSGRVSFVQEAAPRATLNTSTGRNKKDPDHKSTRNYKHKEGEDLLRKAHHILCRVKESPQSRIPCETMHACHKILVQISLLSTGLGTPFVSSSSELVRDALTPMDSARSRERIITSSEIATAKRTNVQGWPDLEKCNAAHPADLNLLLTDDMSLLPASWSIVSLGLSEDKSELLVARLTRERSPFVVRIPLARPDPSDAENGELDFESAKAEIQDIVAKANSSAHDPRGCSADKSIRKTWYAERQSLDQQMATLLDNIENVWFGGFRGLIRASDVDHDARLKFGERLSVTLNRHLPSRQKSSKSVDAKIELHAHVLELFMTLGHPREVDLEDSITDLLYFVVDILQFNGERNAYDEIDFDAVMVEVLDSLYLYYDERLNAPNPSHVILVMDKELQVFPWESLPCLRGQSVSRMPSLGAIWERIDSIRKQNGNSQGYVIPASDGAYLLNPSSDLTSTQEIFGQIFPSQLPTYDAIVNRPPEEKEFETALRDKSLMLYFGHGGGAQYIRGRTIRKMGRCAVTLLMGCSSAKMTECGVYEPYGMPWNYINGGSPAVVGTLWDVTDRDIDRFALQLMDDWGLVDAKSDLDTKSNKSGKGRSDKGGKARNPAGYTRKRGVVALDQAVAQARDACMLKYLNGAAPVMYGIPVFLD
ncbi:uncharacterized protein Z518_08629 [Rhinocladiella mackenziei CBS 650.93]|uniref:separase n=1 Tax=Rhinocladiella mackenziei CBS 650.93 TaxID=1442369 RepID=A0A0D2FL50_9EURO|nr:uncharacterized protein Z518_08629 [Rhinocladiella mackenziei CBS 650.93]KIX02687.1 hypothetical protein Z518_08629 [Rhinocladiella mackenziei CBS 650.93]